MSFDKEAAFIQLTLHIGRYIYDRTHFQFQTASFTYGRLVGWLILRPYQCAPSEAMSRT